VIVHAIKYVREHALARYGAGLATGALLFGGGYAIAAGGSTTIHSCVQNKTRVILLKARCGRGEHRLVWNQQGPQGVQGPQGPQGPQAPTAWAFVGSDGTIGFAAGRNISVQHTGTGTYAVQATASGCPDGNTAPVVTPQGEPLPSAVPVASVFGRGRNFIVYTGTVSGGTFAASDGSFDISVPCS
jgi:hypothetical protein